MFSESRIDDGRIGCWSYRNVSCNPANSCQGARIDLDRAKAGGRYRLYC